MGEGSDAAVKYHLVEAEEVDPQRAAGGNEAKPKKKGKLNWAQFPLDTDESEKSDETNSSNEQLRQQRNNVRGRGRGGRFGGRGGRGQGGRRAQFDNNGVYYNGVYVPNTDNAVTSQWAKNQIEFYFTPDNLVRDIFLRQHMDVDGYVPLAFVGSFQAVYSVHQDYASLLEAMKASEVVELDEENEKIRLRNGWEKWLWPNAEGSYGVARYIKSNEAAATEEETSA